MTGAPSAEPLYFGSPDRPRFGWVHRPAAPSGPGLVIVPPFGYEAICAHRALRHLAEAAAGAGLVAVRLDLDGTGDSAGHELDDGRLEAWLASIDDACDLAIARGADRLVLAGVRLGASLAALAAERRSDVAGIVAIAPVPSGKALLRELRALQMALALPDAPPGVTRPPEDIDEVAGFALTPETRASLSLIDLLRAERRPAPAVLLLDRDDRPPNNQWVERLTGLGAAVTHRRVPGYVEMVLDPHTTEVPQRIIDAVIEFAASVPPMPAGPPPICWQASRAEIDGVTEEPVALDDCLLGIATLPRTPPRRAVILLNAGAVRRIGLNRMYGVLARRLASRGDQVLRLDLSGLGDSPARPGAAENVVYGKDAIAEVGIAVAWARRAGAREVAVAGLCSGAYHALKAAVAGQAIDTIVVINPLTFFYKPGMPLDFAAARVTADVKRYGSSVQRLESWGKLLRGEVNLWRVVQVLARRALAITEHRTRDVLRRLRVPLHDDLGTELLGLGRRGVAMRFILAGDDPGHTLLIEQGGSAVTRLKAAGRLAVQLIPDADHTFTRRWTHPLVLDAIASAVAPR